MEGFSPKEKLEVKPCPFCRTKQNLSIGRTTRWWISCDTQNCGAEGPHRKTKKAAIEAWNTRL
jgi:Lar family restriction alleviation protein